MSQIDIMLIGTGITANMTMLAWLMSRVNQLLVRQAVNCRNAEGDERTVVILAAKVESLGAKVEELSRALKDFQATLAQFVRKGDKR